MTHFVATLGELVLDMFGLIGVIAIALIVTVAGFKMLGKLLWRSQRERISTCATLIATELSLTGATPPDQRMKLWQGRWLSAEH